MMNNETSQTKEGTKEQKNPANDSAPNTMMDCNAWKRTKRFSCSISSKARPVIQPSPYATAAATLASSPTEVRALLSGTAPEGPVDVTKSPRKARAFRCAAAPKNRRD